MTRTLLAVSLLALALPVVLAEHTPEGRCASDDPYALGIVEVTTGDARHTYYLDDRGVDSNGVWVYQETGGAWKARGPGIFNDDVAAHNLQRGGASPFVPDATETCIDDPLTVPDVLIF